MLIERNPILLVVYKKAITCFKKVGLLFCKEFTFCTLSWTKAENLSRKIYEKLKLSLDISSNMLINPNLGGLFRGLFWGGVRVKLHLSKTC